MPPCCACVSRRRARATRGRRPARTDLVGAGATFPYPLYRAWFTEYGTHAPVRINYYSVGSIEGLRLLADGRADFGASDRPLPRAMDSRPSGCERLAVPTVKGPIAVVYTVPGVDTLTPLRLDDQVLAGIFAGRITHWNALALRALNPMLTLPDLPIIVVHRGVGSGTSKAFGDYLVATGAWPRAPGDTGDVRWPVGIAAEGNEGVAVEVKVTNGAIGYVELSYARQNALPVAALRTALGSYVQPGSAHTDYPITARTWLVIDPSRLQRAHGAALVGFVRWALHAGAEQARALEYTPVRPDTVAHYDSVLASLDFARCSATQKR